MNKITETLQMDHLIMEALREDISSEDVTTNSVMKEAVEGEVEVENLDMVKEAVEAGADIIMLDNMSAEEMREAIRIIDGRAETECSGNVTKENIGRLTALGVDYISSGALTHSAPILDISLKNLHAVS